MDVITLLSSYFAAINLIGFALMGIDKHKAKKRAFRIPEATPVSYTHLTLPTILLV